MYSYTIEMQIGWPISIFIQANNAEEDLMVRVIYLTRYCDYSTAESGGLPWAAMAMISLLTHRRPDTEYLNSLGLPPLCVD